MRAIASVSLLLLGLAVTGCVVPKSSVPDIARIYQSSAQASDLHRNPVIVIPGILGSKLVHQKSGKTVWGAYRGRFANPRHAEDQRLLALPMKKGAALSDYHDEVMPAGALESFEITIGGVLGYRANAYAEILRILGAGGYTDEDLPHAPDYRPDHFTCFQFDYDWRRSNVENARLLSLFIKEKKTEVEAALRRTYGIEKDVKFDIVALSMGGLVTRYYMQYGEQPLPEDGSLPELTWEGAKFVDKAVIVGTPNAGSMLALDQLLHGYKIVPGFPRYDPVLLGTFPSIYELLPRTRHGVFHAAHDPSRKIDVFDPAVWERYRWGLLDPEYDETLQNLLPEARTREERLDIARDRLRRTLAHTRQFHAALDRPVPVPAKGLKLFLFAGDSEPTPLAMAVDTKTGCAEMSGTAPGDATVLRTSALMQENEISADENPTIVTPIPWRSVTFIFRNHIGITKDPAFADNLLFLLLNAPY